MASEQPAARLLDTISHTSALSGMIGGMILGAVVGAVIVGATIATGGAALAVVAAVGGAVALSGGLGLAGQALGQTFSAPTGSIVAIGAPTVLINKRPAARAIGDTGVCSKDGPAPVPIAQGSGTVVILGLPAARKNDKMACGATISSGSPDVVVGEKAVTYVPVASEVPAWLENLAVGMVYVGTAVSLGAGALAAFAAGGTCGLIAFGGQTVGGLIGGAIGGKVGGAIGEAIGGERGRIIGETVGDLVGGHFGEKAGGRMTAGHPVDVATGELYTRACEFELGGPLPLVWARLWMSSSSHNGELGSRWHHPLDFALARLPDGGGWVARIEEGRLALFLDPAPDRPALNTVEGLLLKTDGHGHYWITSFAGRDYLFGREGENPAAPFERPLAEIRDANGNRIVCQRNKAGHLSAIIDSAGRTLPVSCDNAGRILTIDGPHPDRDGATVRLATYDYDEAGRLVTARDGRGSAWRYRYANHLLIEEQRRGGLVYHFIWDDVRNDRAARCIETWGEEPGGGASGAGLNYARLIYDVGARTTLVTSGMGALTRYSWNERGKVETVIDPLGGLARFSYDEGGREITCVRADGATRMTGYDALGRIEQLVDFDRSTTAWTYGESDLGRVGLSNPVKMLLPGGAIWLHSYDERGNLVATLDPAGVERRILRNPRGAPLAVLDPIGAVRRFAWSTGGELLSAGTSERDRVRYQRDALGRIVSVRRGADAPLALSRDANGNLIGIARADGGTIQIAYDAEDRAVVHRDPLGRETHWDYGGLPCPRMRTAADNSQVRYAFDGDQKLTAIINEVGDVYRLTYDVAGRLKSETGFDGRQRVYTRDAVGFLLSVSDQGRETRYKRDPSGRLRAAYHADGTSDQFEWDARGNMTAARNAERAVELAYDACSRLIAERQDDMAITHERDARGRLVATRLPDGRRIETRYDSDDEIGSMHFDGREVARFSYDSAGREIERRAGAVQQRQTYDAFGRLVRQEGLLDFRGPRTDLADGQVFVREYGYDVADRLVAMQDARFGAKRYGYDACDRLLDVDGLSPEQFVVDPAGTLLAMGDGNNGDAIRYGGEARQGRLVRTGNGTQFSYDIWGNLAVETRDAGETIHYDHDTADQLVTVRRKAAGVIGAAGTTRFGYDALGRRAWKETASGRVTFLWNGNVLLAESTIRPVAAVNDDRPESDAAHPPLTASLALVYLFEPGSFRPLAQVRRIGGTGPSLLYHYHLDHLGTPREMTNDNGELVWAAELKAWGAMGRVAVKTIDNPLRFQGQYHDVETGLHYNRHRYFAPEHGRFLQQDPTRLSGGLNLYQYGPNPVNWCDPLGLIGETTPGYTVYGLYDKGATDPYYVGITDDPVRRRAEHKASGRLSDGANMEPLDQNVTYGEARGYEQARIEHHGTKTGTIGEDISPTNRGNKVNSYDVNSTTRDPARQKYFDDARDRKMSELNGTCG